METATRPGETINASQLKSFLRCDRLWAFQYLLGIPSVGDALALGTAVHSYLETYLRNGELPPEKGPPFMVRKPRGGATMYFPGEIARKGLDYLPPPGSPVDIETGWTRTHAETGITFHGTMDFFFSRHRCAGIPWSPSINVRWDSIPGGGRSPTPEQISVIGDHKTTASRQYALTADELRTDTQFILYAWESFQADPGAGKVGGRWVYYPKRRDDGFPVDVVATREQVMDEFNRSILPVAEQVVRAARAIGLDIADPRKVKEPKTGNHFKLHILNQLPFKGNTDDRCEKFGGCWFKGICFDYQFQLAERKGADKGTCGPECSVGSCSHPETKNPAVRVIQSQVKNPGQEPGESKEGNQNMNPNDPTTIAAAWARIQSEGGLNEGWKQMAAPHEAFVFNVKVVPDRAVPVVEYLEKFHQSPAPAVNPPAPPAAPAIPQVPAPAAPVMPQVPAAVPAPVAPVVPAPAETTAQTPAAPASNVPQVVPPVPGIPQVPAGVDEAEFLYGQCVARGLIPAGRPGRRPKLETIRTLLTNHWTLDGFKAWEESQKAAQTPAAPAQNSAPQVPAPAIPQVPAAVVPAVSAVSDSGAAQTPAAATTKGKRAKDAPRNGFLLLVECLPAGNRPRLDFARDILPKLVERIESTPVTLDSGAVRNFADWRLIPFGKGAALLAAACAEFCENMTNRDIAVTIDSRTPAALVCLDTLREYAAEEFQGV